MGGDGGDAKGLGGVLPPGGKVDHGYDSDAWVGQGVGIHPGGGGNGSYRNPPHKILN